MKITKRMRPWVTVGALVAVVAALLGFVWSDSPNAFRLGETLSGTANDTTVNSDTTANSELASNESNSLQESTTSDNNQSVTTEKSANTSSSSISARSAGSILANERIVTYYGHPYDGRMGILGQLSMGELVAEVADQAAAYEEISDLPVQPAIHIIATVAQEDPGEDGMYRARTDLAVLQEYADLAAENGMLFILDVQVGHSSVQNELEPLIPLLQQYNVHLALDPEFDMWGGQLPGEEIGSMTADEINYAQGILSEIVAEQGGPNKILIVHQFTPNMITDKGNIVDDPNVDLAVVMDGFGTDSLKIKHYNMFVRDEPVEYGGIKLFYTQDAPLMSPADVLDLDPIPNVIIYQ